MKTYVAHLSNFNLSDGIYYSSKDNYKSINKFSGLKEFENLDHKDTLIVLLPSILVGSFPFKSNEKLSQQINLANFISDIDSDIPSDVSQNEFLILLSNNFLISKASSDVFLTGGVLKRWFEGTPNKIASLI